MFALLPALLTAVASEFIKDSTILKWVGFAGEIVQKGAEVDAKLQMLTEKIKQMVLEQRNPRDDEWDDLERRSEVAHATIQSWKPTP